MKLTETGLLLLSRNTIVFPFGLEMQGNGVENTGREHRYKFNGIEEVNDFGLGLYTAKYRTYDPAIGR